MTAAERLRALAAKATPGAWTWGDSAARPDIDFGVVLVVADDGGESVSVLPATKANARLKALAPDLADWAADAAEFIDGLSDGSSLRTPDNRLALLARLDRITEEQP